MSRKAVAILISCLVVVVTGAYFVFRPHPQTVAPLPANELTKITVAHWGQEKILIYLPLYVAIDKGFCKKQGLDVTLKYSGNDDQVFATVIAGQAQFGVGDPTFTAISREKGGPGKVVATLVGAVANWGVTSNPNTKTITDPKMLDGLRVTSFPSPSTTYTILSDIKQTKHLSKMTIKQMAFGTELGALERKDADLAIMLEPQASIAESKGYHVVWSVAEYYGPFTLTGVTTSDDMIQKHPEQVQKLVNALQEALNYIRSNPDDTLQVASQNFPTLDKTVVKNAIARMTKDLSIPTDTRITKDAWIKTLSVRKKVGDLKSVEAGMAAIDDSFAENAMNNLKKK